MSETGNEEYDRDAYSASQFAKGGSTYAKGGEVKDYFKKNLEIVKSNKPDSFGEDYYVIRDKKDKSHYVEGGYWYIVQNLKQRGFTSNKEVSDMIKNAKEVGGIETYAKGGKLDETKYIPRDEIIKVELKNGKVIVNSWNNPIYSGLRIGKGISEREEMEEQGQLAMFKRGGKMPKYAQYVSQRDIAKVYLYDEDEPTEISGRDLVGGIYYDNEKATKLIEMARERGLIK